MNLRHLPVALLLSAALACGGGRTSATTSPTASPTATPAAPATPLLAASPGSLARYAAVRVVVLPLQGVRGEGAAPWRGAMGSDSMVVLALDGAIEQALSDRGLSTQWSFPPALERAARRNPTYVANPYRLRAGDAVRVAMRKPSDPLAEPFASQVRALAGVSDARYALVPAELRIEPSVAGTSARAVLRLAVIDTRGAQLAWVGDVASDAVPGWNESLLPDLARRVADLVVLR